MDADTLIYTLNFLRCKLAPLLSCRDGPGALAPPSPDPGVLSASFQPDTAVPSAPSGDRLTLHRVVGAKPETQALPTLHRPLQKNGNGKSHQYSPSWQYPAWRKHVGHPSVIMEIHYPKRSIS